MKIINDLNMTHDHWSQAVSTDSLRPVMNGVYFDLENEVMAATNSHLLLISPCSIEIEKSEDKIGIDNFKQLKKDQSKIVPIEFFDRRKYMGDYKKYMFDLKYDLSDDEFAMVYCGSEIVYRCRYIDGKFPNWKAIWPDSKTSLSGIGVDWSMLQKIYKAIPFTDKYLDFEFHGDRKPIVFKHKFNDNFKGVIMPTI